MESNVITFKTVFDVKKSHDPDYRKKANAAATLKRLAEENSQDYYVFYLSQHEAHKKRSREKADRMMRACTAPEPSLIRRILSAVTGKEVTA